MAGLLVPAKATELVQALKDSTSLPVELHTHYTSGVASMTYMKAVEAGVDIIDTAMSPFALGTSQPATEVMVEAFKNTPYDTGLDLNLLSEIADYFLSVTWRGTCKRSDEPEGTWCKHQHSSLSGTGWYAFQPDFPAQGAGKRGQVRGKCLQRFRVCVKTLVSHRLLLRLPRSLVHRLYLTYRWESVIKLQQRRQRIFFLVSSGWYR